MWNSVKKARKLFLHEKAQDYISALNSDLPFLDAALDVSPWAEYWSLFQIKRWGPGLR